MSSKHIRFLPSFQGKEVDKYFFFIFQKCCHKLNVVEGNTYPHIPYDITTEHTYILLGKAYSAMNVEQSSQYDCIKQAILKAHEQGLLPELLQL